MALRVARIPAVFLLSIPIALVSAQLASYFWIMVGVLGALLDRFGRPRVERELVGQEEVEKTIDPAG